MENQFRIRLIADLYLYNIPGITSISVNIDGICRYRRYATTSSWFSQPVLGAGKSGRHEEAWKGQLLSKLCCSFSVQCQGREIYFSPLKQGREPNSAETSEIEKFPPIFSFLRAARLLARCANLLKAADSISCNTSVTVPF